MEDAVGVGTLSQKTHHFPNFTMPKDRRPRARRKTGVDWIGTLYSAISWDGPNLSRWLAATALTKRHWVDQID